MKFKVGDRVKYIGEYSKFIAYNTTGFIVSKNCDAWVVLFSNDIRWYCMEYNLVKTLSKNQQLEFAFMTP